MQHTDNLPDVLNFLLDSPVIHEDHVCRTAGDRPIFSLKTHSLCGFIINHAQDFAVKLSRMGGSCTADENALSP